MLNSIEMSCESSLLCSMLPDQSRVQGFMTLSLVTLSSHRVRVICQSDINSSAFWLY